MFCGHKPINDGALPFGGWADGGGAFRNWLVSVQISWGPASALRRVDIVSRDLDLPRWRHLIGRMVPDVGWHLDAPPPPPLVNPKLDVRLSTLSFPTLFSRCFSARIFVFLSAPFDLLQHALVFFCYRDPPWYGRRRRCFACLFPAEFRVCCAYASGQRR